MALFNDTTPKKKTAFGTFIKWMLRFLILLIFVILFFIGALNLLQGNGPAQVNGLQQGITALTGKQATIESLNDFKLFPQFVLDVDGLRLSEGGKTTVSAGSVYVQGPGAVIFSKDMRLSDIRLKNIIFAQDDKNPIFVEHGRFHWPIYEGDPYTFDLVSGAEQNWKLSIHLEAENGKDQRLYRLQDPIAFTIQHGGKRATGRFIEAKEGRFIVRIRLKEECITGIPSLKSGQLRIQTHKDGYFAFDPEQGFVDARPENTDPLYMTDGGSDEGCP